MRVSVCVCVSVCLSVFLSVYECFCVTVWVSSLDESECLRLYLYRKVRECICACVSVYMWVCLSVSVVCDCVREREFVRTCVSVCVCVCEFIGTYVCVRTCVWVNLCVIVRHWVKPSELFYDHVCYEKHRARFILMFVTWDFHSLLISSNYQFLKFSFRKTNMRNI